MYKFYKPIPLSPFLILILILNICNLNLSTFYFIDLMLSAAKTLAELNPNMTFIYVSGSGTDSTESRRTMYAKFQRIFCGSNFWVKTTKNPLRAVGSKRVGFVKNNNV